MTRTAALKTTRDEKVRNAQRIFMFSLLDLTWKLLVVMVLPIVIGAFLDKKFNTGQVLTGIGFLVAIGGAAIVMRSIVKKISASFDKDTK